MLIFPYAGGLLMKTAEGQLYSRTMHFLQQKQETTEHFILSVGRDKQFSASTHFPPLDLLTRFPTAASPLFSQDVHANFLPPARSDASSFEMIVVDCG